MPTSKAAPNIEICSSYKALKELGIGFQYYYQLKCLSIFGYIIMFVLSLVSIIFNMSINKGNEWNGGSETSFIVYTSIGNHGVSQENYRSSNIGLHTWNYIIIVLATIFASGCMKY